MIEQNEKHQPCDTTPEQDVDAAAARNETPPLVSPPETGPAEVAPPIAKDYLLTVQVPIAALDEAVARKRAHGYLLSMGYEGIEGEVRRETWKAKLQRLHKDKPPEKVAL